MKNLYSTFILFALLTNQVLTQSVFHSAYKDLNSNIKLTNSSVTSDLINFYISGVNSELPAKIFYLSLDSTGQILYSKKIDSNDFFAHSTSILNQGSSIFLLGYIQIPVQFYPYTYISKINSNGTMNWFKYFSPFIDNIPTSFSVLSDESILVAGYLNEGSPLSKRIFLLKLNSSGNFAWAKRVEVGSESVPNALQHTSDGGYILTGYMKQIVNEPSKLVILKFDSLGVFEFGKTYSTSNPINGRTINEIVNVGYIITAEMSTTNQDNEILLIRTDTVGNIVWSKYVQGVNNKSDSPSSAFINEYEDIYLTGTTGDFTSNNSNRAFLLKANINGNLDWFVSYFDSTITDGLFETSGRQLVGTNQEGVAIAGSRKIINSSPPLENVFFVKTDSLGATDCYYSNVNVSLTDLPLTASNITPTESDFTGSMVNSSVSIIDYNLLQEYPCIVPVELISFEACLERNGVQLYWVTATELNNQGFEIEKRVDKTGSQWNWIGYVQGAGTTSEYNNYGFYDENFNRSKVFYRLKQIDFDGSYTYSSSIEVEVNIPEKFSLEQNYPNPFNPSTKIKYSIPPVGTQQAVSVQIKVFDVLGNEIETLVNEELTAGEYEVEFNSHSGEVRNHPAGRQGLSSGIYFYQLRIVGPVRKDSFGETSSQNGQAGQAFIQTKKMILLR